jgi:hypothetical protein
MIGEPGRLLRVIGRPFVYVAMFSIVGGHWAALQVLAWAQMVQTYSQDGSLIEAVTRTLDGKHPCALCRKVSEGRRRERHIPTTTLKAQKKADVLAESLARKLRRPFSTDATYPRVTDTIADGRTEPPPRPVPRVFLS